MVLDVDKQNVEKFFFFSNKGVELNGLNPESIGFKAFNLMKIAQMGLPVPPGFVIGTKFCQNYFSSHRKLSAVFSHLVYDNIIKLQQMTGLTFGGARNPLLVSVRSGAAVSMPGMLSSILNIGICNKTVGGLALAVESRLQLHKLYVTILDISRNSRRGN